MPLLKRIAASLLRIVAGVPVIALTIAGAGCCC